MILVNNFKKLDMNLELQLEDQEDVDGLILLFLDTQIKLMVFQV